MTNIAFSFLGGGLFCGLIVFFWHRSVMAKKDGEITSLQQEAVMIQQNLLQQKEESQKNQLVMQDRFENLAQKIFEEKSQKFSDQNFKNLAVLLDPFKERLKDFEKKVEDSYSTERAERGSLRGELSKLLELNMKMSQEAENLSRALKGDNKTMGTWGEMILENILDRSGLRKGDEYIIQGTDMGLKNEDGKDIRPDVIVNLPEGKHLVIDSKVSLTAFEAYCNVEDKTQRDTFAKAHVDSLQKHIRGLSEKKYHSAEKLGSPDFVMLFMPVEPAFALAFKLKPDLLQFAWENNIALVSPTTLLTTLRTVSALWKTERQERNAQEIAKRGGALYDKFVGFITDLEDLGLKIEATQKAHQNVVGKLSEGSGNLVRQVDLLRELGAKTEKRLSAKQLLE